jgi:hypothetical protein
MTVAPLKRMPTQPTFFDDNPSVDGPDYVALVIEWDELADDLERQLRNEPSSLVAEAKPASSSRTVKIVAGAIGAIALAWAVIHRLRA